MNYDKKRITRAISFICALGWLCYGVYLIIKEYILRNDVTFDLRLIFVLLLMFCTGISTIIYITLTKYGVTELNEIDKIKTENQILKLQIEQKELKKKLTTE